MLVRTDTLYPVRTTVTFQILLPEEREPVTGDAEVARHTLFELEKLQGVGLRFSTFRPGAERRLHAFLERHLLHR